jgi:hypothetical protein
VGDLTEVRALIDHRKTLEALELPQAAFDRVLDAIERVSPAGFHPDEGPITLSAIPQGMFAVIFVGEQDFAVVGVPRDITTEQINAAVKYAGSAPGAPSDLKRLYDMGIRSMLDILSETKWNDEQRRNAAQNLFPLVLWRLNQSAPNWREEVDFRLAHSITPAIVVVSLPDNKVAIFTCSLGTAGIVEVARRSER